MQTQNRELILLVDDDPGNLKRAQTILGEEFRISATTSGKMALSLLSKVTPEAVPYFSPGSDPSGCKYAGNERI